MRAPSGFGDVNDQIGAGAIRARMGKIRDHHLILAAELQASSRARLPRERALRLEEHHTLRRSEDQLRWELVSGERAGRDPREGDLGASVGGEAEILYSELAELGV